jgi:hypothetical protein
MLGIQELKESAVGSPKAGLPGTKEILLVAVLGMLFTAIWSIGQGKGISWDQQNYHHYNVYAWLNGRMDHDVAPGGQQSWFNPLPYVPQYWLVNHVPPAVAGAIFGAWVGLNFALVYALARLVLVQCGALLAVGMALACLAVGFSDPPFLALIGTTDADQLVSLPVLGSLCLVCWAVSPGRTEKQQNRAYAWAGILLGAAAGLKWTCFVYALGMTLTLVVLWRLLRMNLRRFTWFAAGGVLGYLPMGGYWNWVLWTHFDNPFFPYWNRYFRSAWAGISNYRDMRFPPQSVEAAITYPFQWFVGLHPSSESPFRDARFALLSVLIPICVAVLIGHLAARRWAHRGENVEQNQLASREHQWLLLTFGLLSYVAWIKVFAIQRYLTPLTLISGLLLLLALDWLIPNKVSKLAAFSFLALFSVLWTQVEPDSWRVPYGSSWFGVELPPDVEQSDTLFIMLGDGPMSYVVPYLPDSTRTVRLYPPMILLDGETELVRRATQIIAHHSGPMRSLAMAPLKDVDFAYLKRFGLALHEQECAQFRTATDQFNTCPVTRAVVPTPQDKPQEAQEE